MSEYKFSVVMNIYGGDNFENIKSALDSILQQTLKPDEVIMIIDGPINKEIEIMLLENKGNIDKLIRFEKNVGLGVARGRGIKESSYDYVAIMDADDLSLPNRFELQIQYIKDNPNIDALGGQIQEFDNVSGNIVGMRIVPKSHEEIIKYMKKRCPFNHVTMLLNKKKVIEVGNYEDFHYNEDYILWIKMYLAHAKFANIPETIVKVRVDRKTYGRRGGLKYFISEKRIFTFMKNKKIINFIEYYFAVSKRFLVQLLLPSNVRRFIYKNFARTR